MLTQSVSRFDVVALSIFAVLLCALAVGVGRMGFPIRTLYRVMTAVAATYILTELGVTLLLGHAGKVDLRHLEAGGLEMGEVVGRPLATLEDLVDDHVAVDGI